METATATTFHEDVEKFLVTENLSATRFGVLTVGDTKFVKTLRAGRKVRGVTQERVRKWMTAQVTRAGA